MMVRENQNRISDQEWENRVLCSDDACIGTIGEDGRCRECGLAYDGPLPDALRQMPQTDDTLPETASPAADPDAAAPIGEEAPLATGGDGGVEDTDAMDDAWEKRILCRDEACIGTIGPDGKCKECGLPYAEGAPDATPPTE